MYTYIYIYISYNDNVSPECRGMIVKTVCQSSELYEPIKSYLEFDDEIELCHTKFIQRRFVCTYLYVYIYIYISIYVLI